MTHETKEKNKERSENEIYLGLAFSTCAWLKNLLLLRHVLLRGVRILLQIYG